MSNTIENVLILQGGGSLGAFGCGVFKALTNSNIKIDIIAGTSIGGLNAAIMASSKEDHPEKALEQFWLELAEGSNANANLNSPFTEWLAGYPTPRPAITPITSSSTNTNHGPLSNNTYSASQIINIIL
jgi:ABC-type glycerol-3-phosphate transport system substrate-binding protein